MHFLARVFDELFSGFSAKFQKIVTCVDFSIKFAKTIQKFAENSEFCEKNSLLFKIIHFTPRLPVQGRAPATGHLHHVRRVHPGFPRNPHGYGPMFVPTPS